MILRSMSVGTAALTSVAMLAFAANSLLCRLALEPGLIDPASFASLRIASGALTLALIALPRLGTQSRGGNDYVAVAMLIIYVACFSYAYVSLAAGTGALILFGAVQVTMFVAALRAGAGFPPPAWIGLTFAMLGLVCLVAPGLAAPDPGGAALMGIAGVAWGVYSLRGRIARDALLATARSFIYALPAVAIVSLATLGQAHASPRGMALAIASGSITSGLGYVVWFAAVKRLAATAAATVQLAVPLIAAFGGVALLGEDITPRLLISSAAILGGIWLVLAKRARSA